MEKLILLRKQNKKTQSDVADYLGISYQAYAGYEKDRRQPDPSVLVKLADYFDVSVDYLLGRQEKRAGSPPANQQLSKLQRRCGELSPAYQEIVLAFIDQLPAAIAASEKKDSK